MCILVNGNIRSCQLRIDRRNTKQTSSSKLSAGTFLEPCLVGSFGILPFSKLYNVKI